jgi:regulator of replication initiation timing
MGDLESNMIIVQGNVSELYASVGDLDSNVSELYMSVGGLESNVSELYMSVGDLESNVSELYTSMGDLESNVSELYTSVGELESNVSELYTSVGDLESNISELYASVGDLESNMIIVQGNVSELYTSVNDNHLDIGALQANVLTLETQMGDFQANVINVLLESNVAELLPEMIAPLQANVLTLETGMSDIDSNVVSLYAILETLQTRINELETNQGFVTQSRTLVNHDSVSFEFIGTPQGFVSPMLVEIILVSVSDHTTHSVELNNYDGTRTVKTFSGLIVGTYEVRISVNETLFYQDFVTIEDESVGTVVTNLGIPTVSFNYTATPILGE